MARGNKNILKNIAILFLATVVAFLLYSLDQRAAKDVKTETHLKSLAKNVLVTTPKVEKALRDTFKMIMEMKIHDTVPNPPVTIHDTSDIFKRSEISKAVYAKYQKVLKDSIVYLTSIKAALSKQVSDLKQIKKNITFKNVNRSFDVKSRIDSNADIVVLPFKRKARATIFSPQKNYMRVFNKFPGGTVNKLPFYDYEQTNDELNLLLFQARSAYNFNTGTFSYGPGIELKINRISISGAMFFNSNQDPFRNPTFSLGTRFDLYRIRFK